MIVQSLEEVVSQDACLALSVGDTHFDVVADFRVGLDDGIVVVPLVNVVADVSSMRSVESVLGISATTFLSWPREVTFEIEL